MQRSQPVFMLLLTCLSFSAFSQSSVSSSRTRLKLQQFLAKPVHADFEYINACTGKKIEFVQNSTFRSGKYQSAQWDFDDGLGFSTKKNPTYSYKQPGIYAVKLIVFNNNGGFDTNIKYVEVKEKPLTPDNGIKIIETCQGSNKINELLNIKENQEWYLDKKLKKLIGKGKNLRIDDLSIGEHTLYLITNNGCKSHYKPVKLLVKGIISENIQKTFCSNDYPVDLSQGELNGIWFGKGIVERHYGIFDPKRSGPGNHLITFSDNINCLNNKEFRIHVVEPPIVDMSVIVNTDNVEYIDKSNNSVDRIWDLGDGNYSGNIVNHYQYDEIGNYDVSLTVIDNNGCLNTAYETIDYGNQILSEAGLIRSTSLEDNLNIYPIPVMDNLTLDIGAYKADRMIKISLFDLSGKIVFEKTDIDYYTPKHTLNVSKLLPGTYFARIEVGNDVVSKRIAIK